MHFGSPSKRFKDCYTMVLKGHIALADLIFPENTLGSRIDMAARSALWSMGLDYNHGTGHGVGSFLNVHEGPQGISPRMRAQEEGFKEGMTISNEPGYYEDGEFGIRIESLCITVTKSTPNNFCGRKFLGFETVTMVPISTHLINMNLLSAREIEWINEYHRQVRESLSPLMNQLFPEAVEYLIEQTKPIYN